MARRKKEPPVAEQSTALAIIEPETLPILLTDIDESVEFIRAALGRRKLTPRSLETIRMPTAGQTEWRVPTPDGMVTKPYIDANIVGIGTPRVYWQDEFGKGERGAPPACKSDDGVFGDGLYGVNGELGKRRVGPMGACDTCPMNVFAKRGSGERGKPCAEMRNVFILPVGDDIILPQRIAVTPGSIQQVDDYVITLGNRRVNSYGVITRISLVETTTKDGRYKYGQIALRRIGTLSQADMLKMRSYFKQMEAIFNAVPVDRGDVDGGSDSGSSHTTSNDEAEAQDFAALADRNKPVLEGDFREV